MNSNEKREEWQKAMYEEFVYKIKRRPDGSIERFKARGFTQLLPVDLHNDMESITRRPLAQLLDPVQFEQFLHCVLRRK